MLSHSHKKLLKNIQKQKVIRVQTYNKDLDYLFEQGLIEITACNKPDDYFAMPCITEKGKAELYERKQKFLEVWLPVTLSNAIALAALIISLIALWK